jgi:hypothetical protein
MAGTMIDRETDGYEQGGGNPDEPFVDDDELTPQSIATAVAIRACRPDTASALLW